MSHSFIITVLLAAFAVAARGESRTLRHYRPRQYDDVIDTVSASIPSRIGQQRVKQKLTEAANMNVNPDNRSLNNNNGGTIISSLFQQSDGKEIEETYQYGVGEHSVNRGRSSYKNVDSQKLVTSISVQTTYVERNDSIDASQKKFTNKTIEYSNHTNTQIDNGDERYGIDPIFKNLFSDPEERDVHYYYAIGNGEEEQIFKERQADDSDGLPTPSHPAFAYPVQNHRKREDCRGNDCISNDSVCNVPDYECCSNVDCIHGSDICANRNCIYDGYFRFTLTWIGDDDYDLFVVTPDGTEISYNNVFDPISLGKLETDVDQEGYGYHTENIYFPLEGGPSGVYRFFVRPFFTIGESDEWSVTVMEAGNLVVSESGFESSESFFCKKDEPRPTRHPVRSPTQHPIISPITHYPTQSPATTIPPISTSPTATPVEYPVRPPLGQPTLLPVGLPPLVPTASTGPPQSNDDDSCNSARGDDCCVSSDCNNTQDICEQRTCIKAGTPRFTLMWTGYTNLNLYVITPDGVQISIDNTFDLFSGGRYERDTNDEVSFAYRVENVYFPVNDSPSGTYTYGVRSDAENDVEVSWTIETQDKGSLVETHSGSGDSETFTYSRRGARDKPQRPKPEPPSCSSVEEECCIDADCANSKGDLCIQRICINEGSLRITLEWIGDDNLHLSILTPTNVVISNDFDFDIESGGRHESSEQSIFGFNVESVYFPSSGAPIGIHEIDVNAFDINGVGADIWRIRVYEDGEMKFEDTGFGDSAGYYYDLVSANTLMPAPPMKSPAPTSNPQISDSGLCNFDSACADDTQVCVRGMCIKEGNPRFTLQWPGGKVYGLTVVTPDGIHISAFSPFDADSGGIFEGPTQQLRQGDDVESIYFPIEGGPPGLYTYYVTSSGGGNSTEAWIATVYENGKNVALQTGSGKSDLFSFHFAGSSLPEEDHPNNPRPIACGTTSDCLLLNTICIKNICIEQGTPQFVLSWDGYSDISLSVATPLKTTLSSQNPSDLGSGGNFKRYDITDDSNSHIENIYFAPEQGPAGMYPFYIDSNDKGDTWTVTIFVDGEENIFYSGQGSSEILFFDYSGNVPATEPPNQEQCNPTNECCKNADCLSDGICVLNVCIKPVTQPPIIDPSDQEQCNPARTECCMNADCLSGDICVLNACVKKGAPQFLLSWEGDYDIALSIVTPVNTTISWQYPLDLETGGKFNEHIDDESNRRIENIYFAPDQGPLGIYPYYVHSFVNDGDDDTWTLTIYIDGQEIISENGQGSSDVLFFDFSGDIPTISPQVIPTMSPTGDFFPTITPEKEESCDPLAIVDRECCSDSDCFPNEACTSRTCVDEGNPRFTLSWKGANDLDLFVVTPLETVISYSELEDPISGGKFGEDFDQFEYGLHVENIYFPMDGPIGEYSFYVRSFLSDGDDDEWTVGVYVSGEEQFSVSGTGSSQELTYNFSPTPS